MSTQKPLSDDWFYWNPETIDAYPEAGEGPPEGREPGNEPCQAHGVEPQEAGAAPRSVGSLSLEFLRYVAAALFVGFVAGMLFTLLVVFFPALVQAAESTPTEAIPDAEASAFHPAPEVRLGEVTRGSLMFKTEHADLYRHTPTLNTDVHMRITGGVWSASPDRNARNTTSHGGNSGAGAWRVLPPVAAETGVKRSKAAAAVVLVLLAAGCWERGQGVYIHAKAALAQVLLRHAWARTLDGETGLKPWPWADWWPVARLIVPEKGVDLIVLRGDSGSALAFGPGHLERSALPGEAGNSVISGHRDTHFRFVRELRLDDRVRVQSADGMINEFRVLGSDIIDAASTVLALDLERPLLTLVTCYPFDTVLPGGPLRYVVAAEFSQRYPPS